MAGFILALAILLIAPSGRTQAMLEDPPKSAETGATPDPAQNQNPVNISVKIDQSHLKPGQTAKLLITVKLDPGWHIYALTQPPPPRAAKVSIDENGGFKLAGPVQQPKPRVYKDPNFSEPDKPFMSQTFENEVTFTAPIKVANDAKAGAQKLIAKFSYQACDDQTCLRPTTKTLEVATTIAAASVKATPSPAQIQATAAPEILTKRPQSAAAPGIESAQTSTPAPATSTLTPSPTPAQATETPSPTPAALSEGVSTIGIGAANPAPPTSGGVSEEDLTKDLKNRGLFGFAWFAIIQGL
ncbi:MAG: hypothetical protein J2P52_14375, partial [Blastocatellia bacterium]|nr:hypothetical protein [Blastocatellia bacterium]